MTYAETIAHAHRVRRETATRTALLCRSHGRRHALAGRPWMASLQYANAHDFLILARAHRALERKMYRHMADCPALHPEDILHPRCYCRSWQRKPNQWRIGDGLTVEHSEGGNE